jgi:hypothetical protein
LSAKETNVGWFPSELPKRPVKGQLSMLEDPWFNGALLSELIAQLCYNDKSMVKEVSVIYTSDSNHDVTANSPG